MIVVALAAAAAAGALARYGLDQALRRRWPPPSTAPILVVNVTGSLLLGALTGLALAHSAPGALLTVAGTGFCGSYTTFSTACWETVGLVRRHRWGAAAGHLAATVGASTAAAAVGLLAVLG
ncbi:fluoride efflux transporter FluC [Pseudonocardia lacus]|uniref:fluoride efflux transporter FluC n=1 Tax=Pseudonocardia lacus TaxID=2835865 RepID=UPI001BDD56F7|nr:CrcB family protein [Pseudonocardia lacus]